MPFCVMPTRQPSSLAYRIFEKIFVTIIGLIGATLFLGIGAFMTVYGWPLGFFFFGALFLWGGLQILWLVVRGRYPQEQDSTLLPSST